MVRQFLAALAAFSVVVCGNALAQNESPAADPAYTWDLTELYPTVEAWEEARDEVMSKFEEIESRRGTLGGQRRQPLRHTALISDTQKEAARVSTYASLNGDEDLRNNETQERRQLSQVMFARLGESTAWLQPEILRVGEEVITSYIHEDERAGAIPLWS